MPFFAKVETMSEPHSYFIAGTDTEIGKTTIACGLLAAARLRGLSTAAAKPVASGCQRTADGLRNDDALALWNQCSTPLSYDEINPCAFEPAIAPHIAAAEAAVELSVTTLQAAVERVLNKDADFTVIEGAGGWHVPLNGQQYLSDLAVALDKPVILVVGVRLGCVNHALLTANAVRQAGLPLAGWVANVVAADTARLQQNLDTLQQHLQAPCLGTVPYLHDVDAERVAQYLNIQPLFEGASR